MCIKAVFFDVDGVLIDSLADHLSFCKDMNDEYSLKLTIPSVKDFKNLVINGVRVSPMENFFKAVGFPNESAKKADLEYQKVFSYKYKQHPFDGVPHLLQNLSTEGLIIGMVTANVLNIVSEALGENMRFFNRKFCFTKDNKEYQSKADALIAATAKLGINADNLIYVGDQIGDYNDATKAGVRFLGVTYGWGISSNNKNEFPTVDDRKKLLEFITNSMCINPRTFLKYLSDLCGKAARQDVLDTAEKKLETAFSKVNSNDEFGFRQLNEVLLLCNESIVSESFFKFLASGTKTDRETISYKQFGKKVHEFRKLAALQFGSFRFAFNYLCKRNTVKEEFGQWVANPNEKVKSFEKRQNALVNLNSIPKEHLHRLGYISGEDDKPSETRLYRELGQQNFETFLTYDYIDVYVATSMREKWEYAEVNSFCEDTFARLNEKLPKVRYFDPTLSYHENNIAKGLIEGLMLKRSKATVYLVQETDTLGKDSEMASTLAQGKPVIAYIPKIEIRSRRTYQLKKFPLEHIINKARLIEKLVIAEELPKFKKCVAGIMRLRKMNARDINWESSKSDYNELIQMVAKYEKMFYDNRAETLKAKHPLRFQIDLKTGVANGVLVVRTAKQCADLLYRILTNKLEFDIIENKYNWLVIENTTKCAFRVVTKDEMLTNSFWNLYMLGEKDYARKQ